jgi:tryptophan synthase alpha chain
MSRIDDLFNSLKAQGRKALMPFVTAGDPDLEFTAEVLAEMVARGASLFELGIPYSDPIADGPVIQASYTRALAHKIKLEEIFAATQTFAPTLAAPLVTMVSYAIVHRRGPERFVADAQQAGIAGAIVPDLLVEEAAPLAKICQRADFSLVQLVTPTTPRERAVRIAESSTGFLYFVSVAGITGERRELPPRLIDDVAWLRARTKLPICIGFGVSTPDHARLLAPVCDGLIVGSAIVRRIAEAGVRPRAEILRDIGQFIEQLDATMNPK